MALTIADGFNRFPPAAQLMGVVVRSGVVQDEHLRVHTLRKSDEHRVGGLLGHNDIGSKFPEGAFGVPG